MAKAPTKTDRDISEMSWLAHRLSELSEEIQLIDEHGRDVAEAECDEKQVSKLHNELWDQYRGITAYAPFVFVQSVKDALISAVILRSKVCELIERMREPELGDRETIEAQVDRLFVNLIGGLQGETGTTVKDLGLELMCADWSDLNREAVALVGRCSKRQYDHAKEAAERYKGFGGPFAPAENERPTANGTTEH